jgi:hypothetical protein
MKVTEDWKCRRPWGHPRITFANLQQAVDARREDDGDNRHNHLGLMNQSANIFHDDCSA